MRSRPPRGIAAEAEAEAERKLKHRQLVKRAYYQKLVRSKERALTAQHSALLRRVQQQPSVQPAGGPLPSVRVLHDQYVQLTSEKERHARENMALHRRCLEQATFQKKLGAASVAEARERQRESALASEGAGETSQDSESDSVAHCEPLDLGMTPMTDDACFEVIRPAYAEVRSFRTSRGLYTSNAQVFGWTHRYCLDGTKLQYSICKVFPSLTARELSGRGWTIMTTESSYRALHSRGMTSRLHSIQTVNEDNRVFCRELQRPGQDAVMKTLLLASRFQTEDGYMTIYRSLDHTKLGFSGSINSNSQSHSHSSKSSQNSTSEHTTFEPRVLWLDMFAWTSFEDQRDGSGVEFHFGGEMQHFSTDNARFWMLEVLLMALRWENRAVGPTFTLQG
ncbi:hypothetical protein BBJ28_00018881 [Nothophytophthora sp. Chile5]|nr:hypothetical protein BBJ28_00018881 [Nothophytophthora sp. Chile5]